jgi:hypothetical protein
MACFLKNAIQIHVYHFDWKFGAAVVVQLVLVENDVVEEQDLLFLLQLVVIDSLKEKNIVRNSFFETITFWNTFELSP